MTDLLQPVELEAGWAAVEAQSLFQFVRPLSDAKHRFIREAQSGRRIDTGIAAIDQETRGISPGHLMLLVGYSHNGKTQLILNTIHHNRDKRIAFFIPDEPAPLVLTKLASMVFEVSARQLEHLVAIGDRQALRMLDETVEQYPNLLIFDKAMTPKTVRRSYQEACEHWGDEGDLTIFDYLDLMQCGEHLPAKAEAVKTFGTDFEVPVMTLHQTSRSAGAQGRPMRIDSGNYGGETYATYQVGVWRKKAAILAELTELHQLKRPSAEDFDRVHWLHQELVRHEHTITINLSKNKRPGGQLIEDGLDFELLDSGLLRPVSWRWTA